MATNPLEHDRLLQLGREAIAALEFQKAADILFKLPPGPKRDVLLACCYRNTGRPRDAEKLLEPHVSTSADAATERGVLDLALGRTTDALEHFRRAEDLGGTLEAVHGLAYVEELRTRGTAERDLVYQLLNDGLARYPSESILLQTLGIAKLNDGELTEALGLFECVLVQRSVTPWANTRHHVEAHGNLACAFAAQGDQDNALGHVELAMEVCPKWFGQSLATMMKRDKDLASLRNHPRFIAAMWTRRGGTRAERIRDAKCWLAAEAAEPAPLPDPAGLLVEIHSGDRDRINAACAVIGELVGEREAEWEGHGYCEEDVRVRAEDVMTHCLANTD